MCNRNPESIDGLASTVITRRNFNKLLGLGAVGLIINGSFGCLRTFTGKEASAPQVDVIGQKDFLIPQLQELVRFNIGQVSRVAKECEQEEPQYKALSKSSAAKDLVDQVWGELPFGGEDHNLLMKTEGFRAKYRQLERHNVLSKSKDVQLVGCIVYGWNPLSSTVSPTIKDSFVLGHNAIAGNAFVSEDWTKEEYETFIEIERDILSADPEYVLRALSKFTQVLPEDQYRATSNRFKGRRDVEDQYRSWLDTLGSSLVRRLEQSAEQLAEDQQEELKRLIEEAGKPQMRVAAYEFDHTLRSLSFFGDTYNWQMLM